MTDGESFEHPGGSYAGPPQAAQGGDAQYPQYPAPGYAQPGYSQPGYPQPGCPQQGYPEQGYPAQAYAQPGYPPQPYAAYPPQPYGYAPYPGAPQGPGRPGVATAAAVLAYVNAGLLILSGSFLLLGASIATDIERGYNNNTGLSSELGFDGFLNLVTAGLLIAGAVMMTGRKPTGRILLAVGNAVVLAEAVYWLTRFNGDEYRLGGFIVYAVLFGALAILPLAFSFSGNVSRWLRREAPYSA
ncbi:MAG: hypothetical protein ABI345_05110 [Jatrophihabitans sp.]